MLLVAIGRSRHRHVLEEHRHLVEQGATFVELRLDFIRGQVNLKRLLADRPSPVVVTCRRQQDGGRWSGSEEDRQLLLRLAISEGAEYVDLEEDVASLIPRFGATKRIVSHHNFRELPARLEDLHKRLLTLDPDIVKIAALAHQPSDNLRMLRLVKQSPIPMVGFCMGEIGTPSRILSGKFGAPFTYATFHSERTLAPGMLSFRDMHDLYHYDDIGPATAVYGVVADPVAHSLSPLIHNQAFRREGIDAVYVPFRVPREHLQDFLDHAGDWGLRGLSVTIPHKEAVLEQLTSQDDAVQGIGAANTIVFHEKERRGYNTDCPAAMQALLQLAKTPAEAETFCQGKTALVLGAGGAAKAIAFGLKQRGAHVVITGRTLERAAELAARLGCQAVDWKARHATAAQIIVNCTPVGLHPNVDESPFDKHHLKPSMIVFDTVYNPENTLLIKFAREQSCSIVTGIEMFVRQAAMQFELFTGRPAPIDFMRETIRRAISAAKY